MNEARDKTPVAIILSAKKGLESRNNGVELENPGIELGSITNTG